MNEKVIFYLCALVFFIFGAIYFGTSYLDGKRSTDVRARIDDSKAINTELQRTNQSIQTEVGASTERLGKAETELDRAARAIERCEQILRTAKSRTKKTE